MIRHYLKLAWRNLGKYRLQTLLSITGLAVGFVCFVLSLIWLRYETSYDTFHTDGDRMFIVGRYNREYPDRILPYPLVADLRKNLPEIEQVATLSLFGKNDLSILQVDSAFLSLFSVKILSGNLGFLNPSGGQVAITRKLAEKLFPDQEPLGQSLDEVYEEGKVVGAVIEEWSDHTNFPADILEGGTFVDSWNHYSVYILLKLKEGVDTEAFEQKISQYEYVIAEGHRPYQDLFITPLHRLRYNTPLIQPDIRLEHICYFAVIGLFVIICALVNLITLLVSRFYNRYREIGLRVVNGSTWWGILSLLLTEFFLILFGAGLLGLLLIELIYSPFMELTGIRMQLGGFLGEILLYYGLIVFLSSLFFMGLTRRAIRRSLADSLKSTRGQVVGKVSVVVQLIIGILLIYGTVVINRQLHYLFTTDLGFEQEGRAMIYAWEREDQIAALLSQMPGVESVLTGYSSLVPSYGVNYWEFFVTDDLQSITMESERFMAEVHTISPEYVEFYGLKLLDGRLPEHPSEIVVNETFIKKKEWSEAIGKRLFEMQVVGVLKDVYNTSPLISPKPAFYRMPDAELRTGTVLFRYKGEWKDYRTRIERALREREEFVNCWPVDTRERYGEYVKSERTLLKILTIVSVVCVIISMFGVYSLISLSLERRRKEIAIRKINGAQVNDIIRIFVKDYLILLLISAAIAFPAGYLIMNYWLEQYVKRTPVGLGVYLFIFLLFALLMILCTGWKVWRAAVANPAEVVKSE